MRLAAPAQLCAALLLGTLQSLPAEAQDHWSRVQPGTMTREVLERVLGPSTDHRATFDADYSIWSDRLGARQLWVSFAEDGTVSQVMVYPAATMREADITPLFGGAKVRSGSSPEGHDLVSYPLGGALVEYAADGTALKVTLGGGIGQRGAQDVLRKAAQDGLLNLLNKKKKNP